MFAETRISSTKVESGNLRENDIVEEEQTSITSKLRYPTAMTFEWNAHYEFGDTFALTADDDLKVQFSGSLPIPA